MEVGSVTQEVKGEMTRSRRQDPSKTELGTTMEIRCAMKVNRSGNCQSERVKGHISECQDGCDYDIPKRTVTAATASTTHKSFVDDGNDQHAVSQHTLVASLQSQTMVPICGTKSETPVTEAGHQV